MNKQSVGWLAKILAVVSAVAMISMGITPNVHANSFPQKLSGSGKSQYLIDQNGSPWFMNGEAAWSLIVQLNNTDVKTYLDNRQSKGYNLLMVNLVEHQYSRNHPANIFGNQPFVPQGNFAAPQETYFAYADWVIQEAANRGITILLDPAYMGYQCNSDGWCADIQRMSDSTMYNYGLYVGNRYKDDANIIWMIGGDEDAVLYGIDGKYRQMVAGIKASGDTHLMTAHNSDEQPALDAWKSTDTWIDLNNVYTYFNAYTMAVKQYSRSNFKPFFLLETLYENDFHNPTVANLRAQAYWTVLSGGLLGHIFGNCQIWGFSVGYLGACTEDWRQQLNSPGSTSLAYVGKLFMSRDFAKLIPDQAVISSKTGSSYVSSARTSDGNTVILYTPTQMSLTINMSKISGSGAKAWWFNPASGSATLIGTYPVSGTQVFTTPSAGDWVLVIDNESLNLPAPGTIATPASSPGTTIPGDTDGDGHVTLVDYNNVIIDFGKVSTRADFNKSGLVDIYDYNTVISNFGR